jgi:hypothetical protein
VAEYPKAHLDGEELDEFVNSLGFVRFLAADPLDGYYWSARWGHMMKKETTGSVLGYCTP